ncbi:MAG: SPASM domain-containing protein [Vagococcus sp.]|uniref:radical SAM/SPASM domain-containing protein n=1 Tax=Vagococcus TaxID=2737 RepID=UPI002FC86130
MKHISCLIKPASSLCNMRCTYCFYFDVSSHREVETFGRMTQETTERMIDQIFIDLNDGDKLTLAFQGGEPTLAGLKYYLHLIDYVDNQPKKIDVSYAIQTNGLLINKKWCELFKENNFLVGLSMDGYQELHDEMRFSSKKGGTFDRIMKSKALLDEYEIPYNILTVLTKSLAEHPKEIYDFITNEQIEYIQFIPCLDELGKPCYTSYALEPEEFHSFYQELFKLWLNDLEKEIYRSIKLFDDIFNLFLKGQVTACGILGNCQIQYVIEANGNVYPCDFYCLDDYCLGNIKEHSLKELFNTDIAFQFTCQKEKSPPYCQKCPFKKGCGGGCRRMKDAIYVNKEETFCGYQSLLNTMLPERQKVVTYLGDLVS